MSDTYHREPESELPSRASARDLESKMKSLRRELAELRVQHQNMKLDYESFIAQSHDGVWKFNLNPPVSTDLSPEEQVARFFDSARLGVCNDAMAKMYGFDTSLELIGTPLKEMMPADDPRNLQYLTSFVRNGYRMVEAESFEVDRHGNRKIFVNNLMGVIQNGHLIDAWGTQRDVTDQRSIMHELERRNASLAVSERKYRLLFQTVPEPMCIYHAGTLQFLEVNEAAVRCYGYSREEFLRMTILDLHTPKDRAALKADLGSRPPGPRRIEQAYQHLKKDGALIDVELTADDFIYESGDLTLPGRLVIMADVTDRLRASRRIEEATLRAESSQRQLQLITDSLPALISYIDENLKYQFLNAEYEKWFDVNRNDLIGQSIESLTVSMAEEKWLEHVKSALTGKSVTFEADLEHRTKGSRHVMLSLTPDFDQMNDVRGVIVLGQDITERKRNEAEVEIAKESAELANRAKSQFLAHMSHEIRTPLGIMLGFADLALESKDIYETKSLLSAIRRNGQLLSQIIGDILDLSKIEARRLELERVKTRLPATVSDVVALMQLKASEKSISLRLEGLEKLPETVVTDPTRVRQILVNLLGNALKFTSAGEIVLACDSETLPDGNFKLRFRVTDSGVGIAEEHRSRLFQPFTQLDSSVTRRFGGTGLGLMLSRQLAQALGGDLRLVSSEPGKGSVFEAEIFVEPGTSIQETKTRRIVGEDDTLAEPLLGRLVLVVDDSVDNQILVSRYLRGTGAQIETASNGKEALDAVDRQSFDAVLMDLQMPVLGGLEATRALRAKGFTNPVIALTAHALREEKERALEMGFDDYLTKPVNKASLLKALSDSLESV